MINLSITQKEKLFPSEVELNSKSEESIVLEDKKDIFDNAICYMKEYVETNINSVLEDFKTDSYIRLASDFQNYKNRTIKEKSEIIKTGSKKVILDLLSIVDDFERANDLSEGMILIYKKLLKVLSDNSCIELDIKGKDFNPDTMEAITSIPDENMKNKVIDVIQKGYIMNDIIIRFPKVVIGV